VKNRQADKYLPAVRYVAQPLAPTSPGGWRLEWLEIAYCPGAVAWRVWDRWESQQVAIYTDYYLAAGAIDRLAM
jgi:hypothetical protein